MARPKSPPWSCSQPVSLRATCRPPTLLPRQTLSSRARKRAARGRFIFRERRSGAPGSVTSVHRRRYGAMHRLLPLRANLQRAAGAIRVAHAESGTGDSHSAGRPDAARELMRQLWRVCGHLPHRRARGPQSLHATGAVEHGPEQPVRPAVFMVHPRRSCSAEAAATSATAALGSRIPSRWLHACCRANRPGTASASSGPWRDRRRSAVFYRAPFKFSAPFERAFPRPISPGQATFGG